LETVETCVEVAAWPDAKATRTATAPESARIVSGSFERFMTTF
jgi:hypothetical protein